MEAHQPLYRNQYVRTLLQECGASPPSSHSSVLFDRYSRKTDGSKETECQMDLQDARRDLAQALSGRAGQTVKHRIRAARQVLVLRGEKALGYEGPSGNTLHDIIQLAASAPSSLARCTFAVLLIDALAVDGLVESKAPRSQLHHDICEFIEAALPDVLRRCGYPFAGPVNERQRFLKQLHTVIDQRM
jgi:hypothetical protein